MARRGQHSFMKRQKEIKRKQKALEKMERRQGKKKQVTDIDEEELTERRDEQDEEQPIDRYCSMWAVDYSTVQIQLTDVNGGLLL